MMLVIEEYWSKLDPDAPAMSKQRVLPEFELRRRTKYPNGGGWKNKDEWVDFIKKSSHFAGFDEGGKAKILEPSWYGIKSYQLVYLEGSES